MKDGAHAAAPVRRWDHELAVVAQRRLDAGLH